MSTSSNSKSSTTSGPFLFPGPGIPFPRHERRPTLAGALAKSGPLQPARADQRLGFNGVDGVFRFRADGTNERGLAVMEIDNNAATVISPAPRSFAAG